MSRIHWHRDTAQPKIFEDDEPSGPEWLPHHPYDTAKLPPDVAAERTRADASAANTMTRKELLAALDGGKIKYSAKASVDELELLLRQALSVAIESRNLDPPRAGASVRELLALVTGQ